MTASKSSARPEYNPSETLFGCEMSRLAGKMSKNETFSSCFDKAALLIRHKCLYIHVLVLLYLVMWYYYRSNNASPLDSVTLLMNSCLKIEIIISNIST